MKKVTRLIVQYYNTDINKLALMCVFFVFGFFLQNDLRCVYTIKWPKYVFEQQEMCTVKNIKAGRWLQFLTSLWGGSFIVSSLLVNIPLSIFLLLLVL